MAAPPPLLYLLIAVEQCSPELSRLSTCTKFFMLFHHTSFPSSHGLNAGGDRKRGRKGRLVEEWRNIISLRSRRGFVLCRLPSAPSTFLPSLFPPDPGDSELSVAALAMSYALRA